MVKRTSGEREQFWRDLIGRQPASGLSIAQFCKQTGVSANSFFVWKRRLRPQNGQANRGEPRSRSNVFVKRSRSNSPAAAARPLVPVRLLADPDRSRAPHAAVFEVEWPNGLVLRVPAECNGRAVRDVVKALAPLLVGERASC
ncbi:MAG: IS66 family insertion sequence element accessory protein TnpA [Isosphaeraceae bacterium]|jgi:transposase-like protein